MLSGSIANHWIIARCGYGRLRTMPGSRNVPKSCPPSSVFFRQENLPTKALFFLRVCVYPHRMIFSPKRFTEFYGNISAAHFVVTAAAGHDYEYDRATSSVSRGRPMCGDFALQQNASVFRCWYRCRQAVESAFVA